MHDQVNVDTALLRRVLARLDCVEQELQQLRRVRHPRQSNERHGLLFCVLNEELSHNGTPEVERLIRKADDAGWKRSGEKFDAIDIFLNVADDAVPVKTIVTVVSYEGKDVIDAIYCNPSDWLAD